MPPSSHSSSSHSSHSHSSSSRSHSSSGPSRHSSSSHSSSSHSSSSYSGSRSSSSHSSSSYSSRSAYLDGNSPRGTIIARTRKNQPEGYRAKDRTSRATTHYATFHNYIYYPADWVSKKTGRIYHKGFYDENGQHYDNVVFRRNGMYQKVLCKCPYCQSTFQISFRDGEALKCPSCTANIGIENFLTPIDTYTQDPNYTSAESARKRSSRSKLLRILIIVTAALASFIGLGFYELHKEKAEESSKAAERALDGGEDPGGAASNVDIFGKTVYLRAEPDGSYTIVQEKSDSNRQMSWDYGYESYYEKESDCWLWYNTDVAPNLWQYWYEGISSDFGDFGWMEYEEGVWYIESSAGEWIPLPEKYLSDRLWYIGGEE